jgi:FAD/FMN-containing dehydrogenase
MDGEHAGIEELPAERRAAPLATRERAKRSVPSFFPGFLLNRATVAAFNSLFYARHKDRTAVVDYDPYFYPLDSVRHWPRMYGRRGFIQYQALLPSESSRAGMRRLLEAISEAGLASFLAVLKRMGAASPAPLGFPMPGDTLALDLPHRGERLRRLVERLDAIVLEHGGRLYLAKDAMMSRATFERMYPRVGEFRELRRRLDPEGRFASDQARRLGLVEA